MICDKCRSQLELREQASLAAKLLVSLSPRDAKRKGGKKTSIVLRRRWAAMGGAAHMALLSAEQRRALALKAVNERWRRYRERKAGEAWPFIEGERETPPAEPPSEGDSGKVCDGTDTLVDPRE